MNHDTMHYGSTCQMSSVEMSIPCSQSNHVSTSTHTLRQWRKKDVLLGTTTASNSSVSAQSPSPTQQLQPNSPAPSSGFGQQLQHHHAGSTGGAPDALMADTGAQTQVGGQIARVAPHNHYPRGTAAGTSHPVPPSVDPQLQLQQQQQLYVSAGGQQSSAAAHARVHHQHQQYGEVGHQMYGAGSGHPHPAAADYSYTPYKDPTSTLDHLQVPQHQQPQQPTPVKYSEIVEPPINQIGQHSTSSLLNKPHQQQQPTKEQLLTAATKEYHQLDMCSSGGSAMGQHHHQLLPSNQQQYNPASMIKHHHQYLAQAPPHHLSQYYKHAPPMHQYHHQRYPTEANNYLADLNKIAPQMAQSIMNDPHLRDPNQMYAPNQSVFDAQRGNTYASASFQQQQQRLYGRPSSSTYHQKPPATMYPPNSHLPRGYPVKTQSSTVDPYRNMSLYQPPSVPKYPPQQEYSKQLHLMDFNRRAYPENMHQLNYALPSKVSPTSYSQCAQQQYEYSHHYQQNRHHAVPTIPAEYQQMSVKNPYLHHDQHSQLLMPDLVRDNTPKSSNSLKQYLESWNDEDLVGTTEDPGIPTSSGNLDSVDKALIKIARPGDGNENIYVLDSTNIPTETVSQYLQHVPQIDKLPDNIKFYPEIGKINDKYSQYGMNSMEGILNLTSNSLKSSSTSEYSPPACLRAEEPQNIRPVLDESTKTQAFLSLPVIENDEPGDPVARSNLRVDDPVLASTSAIEEDSEVVPTTRSDYSASAESTSEKCSPELGFVDCAVSSGSVIVPNTGLVQKNEVVPKIENSSRKEGPIFMADSVKNSSNLNCSLDSNVSEKVPKNDLHVVPSPVGPVNGETLDLSVSDVSANVEDKLVPDIQEVQDNSVINLASQNDNVSKCVESESAMNLSRHSSTENIESTQPEDTTEEELVNEVVVKQDADYTELNKQEEIKENCKTEPLLVEHNKEKELIEEDIPISDEGKDESIDSIEDIDETSQEEAAKSPSTVEDNHLCEDEVPSKSEEIVTSTLKEDGEIIDEDIDTDINSVTKEDNVKVLDDSQIEEDLKIDSMKVETEEIQIKEEVEREDVCTLKEDLVAAENVLQIEDPSIEENSSVKDDSVEESTTEIASIDHNEDVDNKPESISVNLDELKDSPMSQDSEDIKATDLSDLSCLNTSEEDIIVDKATELIPECVKEEPLIVAEESKEEDLNRTDRLGMDITNDLEEQTLNVNEIREEIPEKELDLTECGKTDQAVTESVKEIGKSESEDCGVVEEATSAASEIISESNSLSETPKSVEASLEDDMLHDMDELTEEEHQEVPLEISEERSVQDIVDSPQGVPLQLEKPENCEEKLQIEENENFQREIDEDNHPANHEDIQEADNEINDGLNVLRILQNNIIIQIADELIQINVINTNDRKIISVIALSDCTVVTENNNNQAQVNVEEQEDLQGVNELVENLVQEEDNRESVLEDEGGNQDKLEEHSVDENEVVEPEVNEEVKKNDTPSICDEETVKIHDKSHSEPLDGVDANQNDESMHTKSDFTSEEASIVENKTSVEDSPLKDEDSVLDNLETMLEADLVPVIDFSEEVNIQNEVIIGPDESQESISQEILLMTCEANKKEESDIDPERTLKEITEENFAEEVDKPNESYLNDSMETDLKGKSEDKEVVLEDSETPKELIAIAKDISTEDAAEETEFNDNNNTVQNAKIQLVASFDTQIQAEVASAPDISSTEAVSDLDPDLIKAETPKETFKTDLLEEDTISLHQTEVKQSSEELEIDDTKVEIEVCAAENKILNVDKEVDCHIEVLLKAATSDELEDCSSKSDIKKIVTKASLKLILDNKDTIDYFKQNCDKIDGVENEDKDQHLNQHDEVKSNSKNLVDEKIEEKPYSTDNSLSVINFVAKKVARPKIVFKPFKRKLSISNESSDAKEEIKDDEALSKVQFENNIDATIVENRVKDQKECSKQFEESPVAKTSKCEELAKTPDRPKIPGVDKLTTKFVIPKKNNSASPNLNSLSTKPDKLMNYDSKLKKPKLVSFSTIVDEIKDRAEAARDKKSLSTSNKLTKILKQPSYAVLKKPINKKRDARSLSETQPKKLLDGSSYRRHSIASEVKNVNSLKKSAKSRKTASNESIIDSPKAENSPKKVNVQKAPRSITIKEEPVPKSEKRNLNPKPLETIIAKISRDAKKVASLKLESPITKPRDTSPVQKKVSPKTVTESPKPATQDIVTIEEVPSNKASSKSEMKLSGIEPLGPNTSDSPKSEHELVFKKESHSPKKYTKVKVFKSRLNSFDSNDMESPQQKLPEVKVKTKAELKEAIHLDIKDEPAVLHIESIISEKITEESKEKYLNASPPDVLANLLSPQSANKSVNLDIPNATCKELVIEKHKDDEKPSRERLNTLSDKEDDTNRKRLSLKEYNSRKRKVSCSLDSPLSMDNTSMNSIDSPLQNLNPEPPEDDLPPPCKLPAIETMSNPPTTFISRMETSPRAEDMNLAAPSTPTNVTRTIHTPQSIRSNSSSATDDSPFLETIELQLMNSRAPNRSMEDERELISKKLEDLLVTIPIGQKSDNLMKRFLNREQLSTDEMVKVKERIEFKRAKEEFLKETQTSSITSGLGIRPLESYRRLNFDIASDISIPVQMNDTKHFDDVREVPKSLQSKDTLVPRSLHSYKKLNFDIASDISIPSSTSKTSKVFGIERLSYAAEKSQPIDSEPVFKRLQAELSSTITKNTTTTVNKAIGINKDKPAKPITRVNRPTIDNATAPKVLIKPSFLSSTTADGKDLLRDNGESVYEISSSTNEHTGGTNRRNSSPTDELKIHLRKVQQPSPTDSLTPTRKRKKKRFRNLYSADTESSDETTTSSTSTNNSPAVKMAAANSSTNEESSGYSVICSGTFSGLPKIIIKRTNSDSANCSTNKVTSTRVTEVSQSEDLGMQPIVRLVRNPRLDNLAKRKRKG